MVVQDIIKTIANMDKLPPEWEADLKVLRNLLERSAKINEPKPWPVAGRGGARKVKIATVSLGPSLEELRLFPQSRENRFRTYWVEDKTIRRRLREDFLAALRRVAKAGAKLVCFNEMSYPDAMDIETSRELRAEIREIVDENQLFVIAGTHHHRQTFHNLCPIFAANREIIPHAKLSSAAKLEEKIRTPAGRVMRYYKTTFGAVGLLICLDAYEPTLFLRMMKQSSVWQNEEGVDFVFVPAFSPNNSKAVCDACQDLSYTTGAIVVYVNCPERRPRHAVFVAGKKMPAKGMVEGYSRRSLRKGIELHTIDLDYSRTLRNGVRDNYSPILRYIMGDERVGFIEKVWLE